jgi:hypothetical protein
MIKKNISVGTPNLFVVLPATTLISNNIDPISKMFSISINMCVYLPTLTSCDEMGLRDIPVLVCLSFLISFVHKQEYTYDECDETHKA